MSAGAFKVGEIAILQKMTGITAFLNGLECEVIEPLTERRAPIVNQVVHVYKVRLADGLQQYVFEWMLRKKQPPKEDREIDRKVEWKDCAWQPNKVPA